MERIEREIKDRTLDLIKEKKNLDMIIEKLVLEEYPIKIIMEVYKIIEPNINKQEVNLYKYVKEHLFISKEIEEELKITDKFLYNLQAYTDMIQERYRQLVKLINDEEFEENTKIFSDALYDYSNKTSDLIESFEIIKENL